MVHQAPAAVLTDGLGMRRDTVVGQAKTAGAESVIQTGRTLLIPTFPFQAEAIARAGLPELPLISGRVVINETFDPVTGAPIAEILSVKGRVVDVCELLAR